jgi:hypothetical protein
VVIDDRSDLDVMSAGWTEDTTGDSFFIDAIVQQKVTKETKKNCQSRACATSNLLLSRGLAAEGFPISEHGAKEGDLSVGHSVGVRKPAPSALLCRGRICDLRTSCEGRKGVRNRC